MKDVDLESNGEAVSFSLTSHTIDKASLVLLQIAWLEYQVAVERYAHLQTQLTYAQERCEAYSQHVQQKEREWKETLQQQQQHEDRLGWGVHLGAGMWVPPEE